MQGRTHLPLLALFLFCSLPLTTLAHIQLRGQVIDAQTQVPLAGAIVLIDGDRFGAETNLNGGFVIEVEEEINYLQVTLLGYELVEIVIEDPQTPILIQMQPTTFSLDQVTISAPAVSNLRTLSQVDVQLRPVRSAQDVLRVVPGLFTAQHAGGGKAEQIFLRGFDIDHGTDIALDVDGMPVNMVSHAHGQGYADAHFIIPELIQAVDFGKGPYYADRGDFTTAGYASYRTRDRLERSTFSTEVGQFNTFRGLLMADLLSRSGKRGMQDAYLAAEYLQTDGPFESPQNFNRLNFFGKYRFVDAGGQSFGLTASTFTSKWDASGQIPQRAVDQGRIGRFGAIDDTEGGHTSRTNILLDHIKPIGDQAFFASKAYYSRYDFELYSNFTFFLRDSLNGDQIRQRETRDIFGYKGYYQRTDSWDHLKLYSRVGVDLRYDQVRDSELSDTRNRLETLRRRSLGDIFQTNAALYVDERMEFGPFLLNAGLRMDYFKWDYQDKLDSAYQTLSKDQVVVSPKLNLLFNATPNLQIYLKGGMGFHSNDARVVVREQTEKTLPRAFGSDLGFQWKPVPRMLVQAAGWYLFLQQEFVYVGDEAIVEPGDPTQRLGFDFSLRYQLFPWLAIDTDVNYAYARVLEVSPEEDRIPLAPTWTSVGGITLGRRTGFNGSLRYRFISDRPANEDGSVTALGYTVFDLNANYTHERFEVGVIIENLLDTDWNEAQFDTESRLRNEAMPVSELHFTPGYPFFVRGKASFFF